MAEPHNQQDLLLQYLLGELSPEKESAFQERFLSDEEFAQDLQEARYELLDAYAAKTLDPGQVDRVEKALLASPEQRAGLKFAVAMRAREQRKIIPAPQSSFLRSWQFSLAAAACVLLLLAAGLVYRNKLTVLQPIAEIENGQPTAAPANAPANPAPSPSTPLPPTNQNPEEVYAVILSPELVRGVESDRTIAIPAQARILDLQIVIEGKESKYYVVELSSSNHAFVKQFDKVSPAQTGDTRYLDVRVPAGALNPGTYNVRVTPAVTQGKETSYRLTIASRK